MLKNSCKKCDSFLLNVMFKFNNLVNLYLKNYLIRHEHISQRITPLIIYMIIHFKRTKSCQYYSTAFNKIFWRRRRDSNPRPLAESLVFKTSSLNHSDTSPDIKFKKRKESRHRLIFPGRLQPSIFSTHELNCRVRNGNGWILMVIDTDYSFKLHVKT